MSRNRLTMKGDGLKRLREMMRELGRKPHVKVGVMGNVDGRSSGSKTRREAGATIDNVALAVIHEYGLPKGSWKKNPEMFIPPRPFLRSTFDAKKSEWNALLMRMAPLVLAGKLTVEQALELLGQRASADVRRRITSGSNFTPNAPSTIRRKGSSRPLVDTGQLVNSISYVVEG